MSITWKKYEHLRLKAKELRLNHRMSLNEISNCLNLPKTTVFGWIKDMPLQRSRKINNTMASMALIKKYEKLRREAYDIGMKQAKFLFQKARFRDFINLYLCEGRRKGRNTVEICNSNLNIIKLSYQILDGLTDKKATFSIQYHVDQSIGRLKKYWSENLGVDINDIKIMKKSNSNKLKGRKWASRYGVFNLRYNDTYLLCKINAWMDYLQKQWN